MRKLRLQEVKDEAQRHTASKFQPAIEPDVGFKAHILSMHHPAFS